MEDGANRHGASTHARVSLVDDAEDAVRRWLQPGRFRAGDRLPPEARLAGMLGISRGTLRSALDRLQASGEIVRRQGSGTFVGTLQSSSGSWIPWLRADSYRAQARAGTVHVDSMSIDVLALGEPGASALGVRPGTEVVQIHRVLSDGESPVAVSHDALHPGLELPSLSVMGEALGCGGTVLSMIATTTGVAVTLRRTRMEALIVQPSDVVGRELRVRETTACVTLHETSFAGSDRVHWALDIVVPQRAEIEVVQSAGPTRPEPIGERGGEAD